MRLFLVTVEDSELVTTYVVAAEDAGWARRYAGVVDYVETTELVGCKPPDGPNGIITSHETTT